MSKRDSKLDEFFTSMTVKRNVCIVEKVGLQDTTLKLSSAHEHEINVKELFFFTLDEVLILNVKLRAISFINQEKYNENIHKFIFSMQNLIKNDKNINFSSTFIINLKIVVLTKSPIILCGVFSEDTSTAVIKLYLMHVYITFINYTGHYLSEILTSITEEIKINEYKKTIDLNNQKYIRIKFYESFIVKGVTSHFSRVIQNIIKKEQMYLTYIKFKNMYILDLSTQQILFDMMRLRKKEKLKKYYKNEKLWQEILYHSNTLMNSYVNEVGSLTYDSNELALRFVKFECTSTYPRLTFIIKFLPILKGVTIIHIYSQTKLSRNPDLGNNNTNTTDQQNFKGYKEIDILYGKSLSSCLGSEVKENPNIEFRYTEPKKLLEIEKFFTEFYISVNPDLDLYCEPHHALKYFDYSILNLMEDHLKTVKSTTTLWDLTSKITVKMLEFYRSLNLKEAKVPPLAVSLTYPKPQILLDYFADKQGLVDKTFGKSSNKLDQTLNLSKIEDRTLYDNSRICTHSFKHIVDDGEDGFYNASHSIIKKADSNGSQTIDHFLKEFVTKKSITSELAKAANNTNNMNTSKFFTPISGPLSVKESNFDVRSNKAMRNFESSKKNFFEKSMISDFTNNDKNSEKNDRKSDKKDSIKEKSISKIKENYEEEEVSHNNTQNYLLAEDKKTKSLFKATFKEDEFVSQNFN